MVLLVYLQCLEGGDDLCPFEQTRQQIIYSTVRSHPQHSHPSRTCVGRDAKSHCICKIGHGRPEESQTDISYTRTSKGGFPSGL